MEIWKLIDEYPEYEVSNYGRVRSIDRNYVDSKGRKYHKVGKILKCKEQKDKHGYIQVMVSIWSNRKMHRLLVHRLVAKAFIPNPNNLDQINHKDENSKNNHVDNLEWCNSKYNVNYGTGIKRRAKTRCRKVNVYDSNHVFIETLCSGVEASKKYNVSRGSISMSCKEHTKVKGFYFETINN